MRDNIRVGRPQAGKTGTTDDAADLWFVGFIPQYTTSVWVGYPDARTELQGFKVFYPPTGEDKVYDSRIFGGTLAAPIWKQFMEYITKDLPVEDFPEDPPGTEAYRRVPLTVVPDLDAIALELEEERLSRREISSAMYKAGLDIEFIEVPSVAREGTVLSVDPGTGARVRQGSTVTVTVSSGAAPELPDFIGLSVFDIDAEMEDFNAATGLELTWTVQGLAAPDPNLWNVVVGTIPGGGATPAPGSEIQFFVGIPPTDPPDE